MEPREILECGLWHNMRLTAQMTTGKNRNARIWLVLVAFSIAIAAGAQWSAQNARAYTRPVIQFLAAHTVDHAASVNATLRNSRNDRHSSGNSFWAAVLPVFFVGLISPLKLLLPNLTASAGRAHDAPSMASLFQRPPPQLL